LRLGETIVFHEPFHLRYTDVRRHLSASVVNVNTQGRLASRFEYVHHAAESHLCTLNRFFRLASEHKQDIRALPFRNILCRTLDDLVHLLIEFVDGGLVESLFLVDNQDSLLYHEK